ncbi:RNA-binding protein 1-like isoform X2 [Babylonia areolata]
MSRHRDFSLDCKVYVGELGHGCAKQELEEKFSKYGTLKNVWVARRPAGFAFVEFEDPRDAEDAVQALDGTRINGRRARVEMSSGRSRSGGGRFGGPPQRSGPRYDDYRPLRRSPSPRRRRSSSRSPSPRFRRRSPSYGRYRSTSRSRSR